MDPPKAQPQTSLPFSLSTRYGRGSSPDLRNLTPLKHKFDPKVSTCVQLTGAAIAAVAFLALLLAALHSGTGGSRSGSSSRSGGGGGSSGHLTARVTRETGFSPGIPDPYVESKFPGENICDRNQYPPSDSLRPDKVTILVNGFSESRVELLQENMEEFAESPVVDAIYVLWGNVSSPRELLEDNEGWKRLAREEAANPGGGGGGGGGGVEQRSQPPHKQLAPVRIVRQKTTSLNDRFLPRKFIRMRAVVICDDDITVDLNTLAFSLKIWEENENRIVGFFPRAHSYSMDSRAWAYTKLPDRYSIMLTKFMILHVDHLFDYTCNTPAGVKEYVDAGMNCEDIAMNFLVSSRSKLGPVLVAGNPRDWGDTRNSDTGLSAVGLSARAGHKKDRGACISEFTKLWGGMELRYSYSKATPDVSEQVFCEKFGFVVHCDRRATSRVDAERAALALQQQQVLLSVAAAAAAAQQGKKGKGAAAAAAQQHGHGKAAAAAVGLLSGTARRYAYTTLVASADLLPAAIAFAQSLRLTGTLHDLVLMVDESAGNGIDMKDQVLLQHYDHVRKVPTVQNRYNVKGFSKLNAWTFDEYDKIVYVDVDTLVIANLDHLFDHPEPSAIPDVYMSGKFNSGLLVLRPSRTTYADMLSKIDVLPSYNKGDQGFLNAYFSGWFHAPPEHRLPARYNAVIFFPEHYHPPPWFDVNRVHEVMGPVMMVHFANPWFKPWRLEAAGNYSASLLMIPHGRGMENSAEGVAAAQGRDSGGVEGAGGNMGGLGENVEANFERQLRTAGDGGDKDGEHSTVVGEEGEEALVATSRPGATQGSGDGEGGAHASGERDGDGSQSDGRMNIWTLLWIRLAKALEDNGWHPLDPDTFSLIGFLPNAADYMRLLPPGYRGGPEGRGLSVGEDGAGEGSRGGGHVMMEDPSVFVPSALIGASMVAQGGGGTGQRVGTAEGEGERGGRGGLSVLHTPIIPPQPSFIGREAFVTVVGESDVFAAGVWATSYLQHHTFNSWHKTVLLVLSTVPTKAWRPYQRLFNQVKVVDPIIVDGRQLPDSFALLHVWNLKGYQKVVYVDPLALFTDNCNELLTSYASFAAAPSVFPPDMFSSHVMVVQPNATTFEDMLRKTRSLDYPRDSIDRFLNAYYHGWFRSSPVHRVPPNFGVDMWFKEGLMKFFVPWKILVFDRRASPWSDIRDWMAHDRTKAVKLWRRTFCSLEDVMKPPALEYMCKDLTG